MSRILIAILLSLASSPAVPSSRSPTDAETLASTMVSAHNAVRADIGVQPMRWNEDLAADAAQWADHLARTGRFEHDARSRAVPEGENLWMGTRGHYPMRHMVDAWAAERRVFRPGRFPDNSRTGSWHDVGHYTQIVWKDTREVGCAVAHNATDEFLVCRYAEAGNVVGESPI